MKTFREIEKSNKQFSVSLKNDPESSGYVTLDQKDTKIILITRRQVHFDTDVNGWFDLELIGTNGAAILIHNAVSLGATEYSLNPHQKEDHIFPNTIIFNSEGLGNNTLIKTISFRIFHLSYFFLLQLCEE